MADEEVLGLLIPHTVLEEIEYHNTPQWKKELARKYIYTLPVSLEPSERLKLEAIIRILTGEGKRENHENDGKHVFIAQKHGSYFITFDDGILRKRDAIQELDKGLKIVKPSELIRDVEKRREVWRRRRKWRDEQGLS
ncbi:MAG: hypothetical protein WCV56_04920 [Candidatus Omnitrophota bacterium]